jgi:hypothetical protein
VVSRDVPVLQKRAHACCGMNYVHVRDILKTSMWRVTDALHYMEGSVANALHC